MPKYRVRWDYLAKDIDGNSLGLWARNDVVELDHETAWFVQVDSGGVLCELEPSQKERLLEAPEDRMVRKASNR